MSAHPDEAPQGPPSVLVTTAWFFALSLVTNMLILSLLPLEERHEKTTGVMVGWLLVATISLLSILLFRPIKMADTWKYVLGINAAHVAGMAIVAAIRL